MSRYRHYDNHLADGLAGGGAIIAIALLILAIYLAVKAINLVVRVFAAYPGNKLLWLVLGATFFFAVVGVISREQVALILSAVSAVVLVIVARLIELYYDTNFQQDRGPAPHASVARVFLVGRDGGKS